MGPESIQTTMIDTGPTPEKGKGEAAVAQAPAKPAKVGEFPPVKPDKVVRLKGTDVPFEQKQQQLQSVLLVEKKQKSDEESLFLLDKALSEALH